MDSVSPVLLVGVLLCIHVAAQPGFLPLPFPPRAVEVDDSICPSADQRDTELARLDTDIYTTLEESVISTCGLIGWTRIVFLNASDPSTPCPAEWEQLDHGDVPHLDGCGRHPGGAYCASVYYPTGMEYSEVCGRVIGHQFSGTDGFAAFSSGNGIDDTYVDGVSITYGSPRSHIWSFAASIGVSSDVRENECPCNGGSTDVIPDFVGENYFCEAGRDTFDFTFGTDALWDGLDCAPDSTCCTFNTPPWFSTTLPAPTSDDLEIRVCGDEPTANENVYMELIEIYVR